MTDIEIIDNHLSDYYCDSIFKAAISKDFPWYFTEGKSFNDDGDFQHCHIFKEFGKVSTFYKINFPILKKLNVDNVIKLFLSSKQFEELI